MEMPTANAVPRTTAGERRVRELNFDLMRLLHDDRQGSYGSRRARRYVLAQAAERLHPPRLPQPAGQGAQGWAHRGAGGGVAAPGPVTTPKTMASRGRVGEPSDGGIGGARPLTASKEQINVIDNINSNAYINVNCS